jgi:hypothetical protein
VSDLPQKIIELAKAVLEFGVSVFSAWVAYGQIKKIPFGPGE